MIRLRRLLTHLVFCYLFVAVATLPIVTASGKGRGYTRYWLLIFPFIALIDWMVLNRRNRPRESYADYIKLGWTAAVGIVLSSWVFAFSDAMSAAWIDATVCLIGGIMLGLVRAPFDAIKRPSALSALWLVPTLGVGAAVAVASGDYRNGLKLAGVTAVAIPLGVGVGLAAGSRIRYAVTAIRIAWATLLRMGPTITGFLLGYLIVIVLFAAFYAAVARSGPAFKGLTHDSPFLDFIYFSTVTMATVGYGDIYAITLPARAIVCVQIVIGMAWTVIMFAILVNVSARLRGLAISRARNDGIANERPTRG